MAVRESLLGGIQFAEVQGVRLREHAPHRERCRVFLRQQGRADAVWAQLRAGKCRHFLFGGHSRLSVLAGVH